MKAYELKKWIALGTGVGVEIGPQDLNVVVARLRPRGARILGSLTIHRFAEQRAAEWGAVYANFLRKLGCGHLAASVLLPRDQVIVRQVSLPGVAKRDLPSALQFQIDSLHPYSDEEVAYSFARIGKSANILVGIARRSLVDRYTALFAEAGVKIAGLTFSAASLYSALRIYAEPPATGFLTIAQELDGVEAYGESAARAVFSAQMQGSEERLLALALSELRLPADTQPSRIEEVLPKPTVAPFDHELSRTALPYATALAGALTWPALGVNLLPAEERKTSSRLLYVPSVVLAVLLLLAVGALTGTTKYQNQHYLDALHDRIRVLQPQATRSVNIDKLVAVERNRTQTLDNFRRHSIDDMDALNELTKVLAPPAWLSSFQLNRATVTISGEAPQAAPLLKLLDSSHQFKRSEMTVPIAHSPGGETFTVKSSRDGIAP